MYKWKERIVAHPDHVKDLEKEASNYEFGPTRLNQEAAENAAYNTYKRNQHLEAIHHHLSAIRAAVSSGLKDEAQKHNALYGLHMKAIGYNPSSSTPPPSSTNSSLENYHKFKPHPADHLLVLSDLSKSESDVDYYYKYTPNDPIYLSDPELNEIQMSKSIRTPKSIDDLHGQKVKVYFNLHNRLFSVMSGGKVVAHLPHIRLKDVKFKVSESGRQRVLENQRKNVHAYVEGTFDHQPYNMFSLEQGVTYNPYKHEFFVRTHDLSPIYTAKAAVLKNTPHPLITVEEESSPESNPSWIHSRNQTS